jgi:NitT/TauT family transport system substrate-binding protein
MIAPKMWSLGDFDRTELERSAAGLKLIGELKQDVDWASLIDESFLPKDLQGKMR